MLSLKDVAEDEDIFRPDGFIKIPRSDGDPNYGPPVTDTPAPHEAEVNYYHIFTREEKRHDNWRSALAEQLVQHFKLPQVSRNRSKWKLYDFPDNYFFTEQRKGPRDNPRTDPYLFGSNHHRFRSTKEFFDHLVWLLLDPSMDTKNCKCKYCSKSPRAPSAKTGSPNAAKRKGDLSLTASAAAAARGAGRTPKKAKSGDVASETSIIIRRVDMKRLLPGVAVPSVPTRDREIMRDLKQGQCEGFRVGEVVWCNLPAPVVDPELSSRQLTRWPAIVLDPTIQSSVLPGQDSEQDTKDRSYADADKSIFGGMGDLNGSSGLNGKVHQHVAYQINFLGTTERAQVDEADLAPFLTGLLPLGVQDSGLGTPDLSPWLLEKAEFPHMNLMSNDKQPPTPSYTKCVVAFAFAVQAAANIRGFYNLTDPYSTADTAEGVLRDLGSGANATAEAVLSGSALNPSGEVDGATQEPSQGMRYYQGLYYGTERIWVGEVVRLRLNASNIRKLQQQLNEVIVDDKPPQAPDPAAIVLDEDASYVMRLEGIFEDPRHPRNVRVTGEMYQIITLNKFNSIKTKIEEQIKARETAEDTSSQQEATVLQHRLPKTSVISPKPGLPAVVNLPHGFVMISLSDMLQAKIPRETVLPIHMIAGRMYPSLGMRSDGPRVDEQIKHRPKDKKLAADEDTQDEVRSRLATAGLLSGCVKAMNCSVQTWSRSGSFKAGYLLARKELRQLITGVVEEEPTTATPTKKAKKVKQQPDQQEGQQIQQDTPSKSTTTDTMVNLTDVQNDSSTPAKAVVQQAPSGSSTAAAQAAATQQTQTQVAPQSTEEEPPLPPGWSSRRSRTHGGTFYVHNETKRTQWERPTA